MTTPDILKALKPVVSAFERLLIPYYIGGSVASSMYGMARATMDIDIVADIKMLHIPKLVNLLEAKYYIDADMITDAIIQKSSFNIIHFETAFKIDVFVYNDEPHQRNAIERISKDKITEEQSTEYFFSSPEDIIIAKLEWFKKGGQVSERQWLDIIGVIKVQGNNLDIKYLNSWSKKLGLHNLLKKAFKECDIDLE